MPVLAASSPHALGPSSLPPHCTQPTSVGARLGASLLSLTDKDAETQSDRPEAEATGLARAETWSSGLIKMLLFGSAQVQTPLQRSLDKRCTWFRALADTLSPAPTAHSLLCLGLNPWAENSWDQLRASSCSLCPGSVPSLETPGLDSQAPGRERHPRIWAGRGLEASLMPRPTTIFLKDRNLLLRVPTPKGL